MSTPKINPLVATVLGAVQDRQTADVARLQLLGDIGREVERCAVLLKQAVALLEELVERTKR